MTVNKLIIFAVLGCTNTIGALLIGWKYCVSPVVDTYECEIASPIVSVIGGIGLLILFLGVFAPIMITLVGIPGVMHSFKRDSSGAKVKRDDLNQLPFVIAEWTKDD